MAYKILLVDDSSVVRKVLRRTFEMTGISVDEILEAGNGQEGLQLLESNWVDLIFLDVNMPVMNGIEFLHRLRKDGENGSIPVVIVSTEGSIERRTELESAGISGYLRKPVSPEQLVETIERVLGGAA